MAALESHAISVQICQNSSFWHSKTSTCLCPRCHSARESCGTGTKAGLAPREPEP